MLRLQPGALFLDPGAAARDAAGKDISARVCVTGDTVTTATQYAHLGSCLEILSAAMRQHHHHHHHHHEHHKQHHHDLLERPQSGFYEITRWVDIGGGGGRGGRQPLRLRVHCDMETDGGGYTFYPMADGSKTWHTDTWGKGGGGSGGGVGGGTVAGTDGCATVGLRVVVPRTRAHWRSLLGLYGPRFFRVVPGIFGVAAGNFSAWAMSSGTAHVARTWRAIDGGSWWLRDTPFSQPSGNYEPGCWLGLRGVGAPADGGGSGTIWRAELEDLEETEETATAQGGGATAGGARYRTAHTFAAGAVPALPAGWELQFDDNDCQYSAKDYVCSTNDKDPAMPMPLPATARAPGNGATPAPAQPRQPRPAAEGTYILSYTVTDETGRAQCAPKFRTVVVSGARAAPNRTAAAASSVLESGGW